MANRYVRHAMRTAGALAALVVAVPCVGFAQERGVASSASTDEMNARITVNVDRAPLLSVLHTIAQRAGLTPVYNEAAIPARVYVTLHMTDVPVRQAFDAALHGTGLMAQWRTTGNVAIVRDPNAVMPPDVVGKVVDATTKRAIAGAAVALDGTKTAVRTADDGTFRIPAVPAGTYTLTVRRLGYGIARQTITVTNDGATPVAVALSETATALEQVVTTVTGAQRRLELGNAIGVINADSLMKEAPVTSLSQLLSARVPGLRISQSQGTVGGTVSLQIRGQTSFNLSSEPIVIVDGVRYNSQAKWNIGRAETVSPLNDLNPNDIETIDVVKGPSAATLYGTDAAHGVIVITTKRGTAGPPRWTAFVKGMTDEIPNSKSYPDPYYGWPNDCTLYAMSMGYCTQDSVTRVPNALTNSRTSVLQPARSWGYGAGVSGGQSNLRYHFSGNFDDLMGAVALPPSLISALKTKRGVNKLPDELLHPNVRSALNLRSNVAASLGSKLDLTVSGGYIRGSTRSVSLQDRYSPFTTAFRATPTRNESLIQAENQFAFTTTEDVNRLVSSVNGQARPLGWLTARGTVGIDVAMRVGSEIASRDSTREDNPKGYVREQRYQQRATSADMGATATFQRGPLSFRTSVGGQYVRTLNDRFYGTGRDLPSGVTSISRAATTTSSQNFEESVTLGTFLEELIGINDRLFLTAATRIDGASAFGSGYSAAAYPKVSASWLLSREPFMPKLAIVDEIRVRTALGASGQQALPTWALPQWDIATPDPAAGYGRPVILWSLGNTGLRPERGREFEMGLDAGLFDRRLQSELTWYRRRTEDQITGQSLPDGLGARYANLGLTTERGFEAQLSATLIDRSALHWQVTLQHSSSATKLVRLNTTAGFDQRRPEGGYAEGYPLGARFIVPLLGYGDTNHNGIIEPNEVQLGDKPVYAGVNTLPSNQTLNTTVGLFNQRVRISALLDRQSGGTLINMLCDGFSLGCRARVDRTAPLADQVHMIARNIFVPGYQNYQYAEHVRFVRLREVSMAVTLPSQLLRAFHTTSGSMSLSARNLGLWTNFSGLDPESVPRYAIQDPTFQYPPTSIPQSRTWALRFDLGL